MDASYPTYFPFNPPPIIILYRKTAYNTLKYAVDTIAHYRADILYLPH